MSEEQPKALRIAVTLTTLNEFSFVLIEAQKELRRLHESEKELTKLLELFVLWMGDYRLNNINPGEWTWNDWISRCESAIANATKGTV